MSYNVFDTEMTNETIPKDNIFRFYPAAHVGYILTKELCESIIDELMVRLEKHKSRFCDIEPGGYNKLPIEFSTVDMVVETFKTDLVSTHSFCFLRDIVGGHVLNEHMIDLALMGFQPSYATALIDGSYLVVRLHDLSGTLSFELMTDGKPKQRLLKASIVDDERHSRYQDTIKDLISIKTRETTIESDVNGDLFRLSYYESNSKFYAAVETKSTKQVSDVITPIEITEAAFNAIWDQDDIKAHQRWFDNCKEIVKEKL